ncbi:MAG: MgtC/SapB family protein [Xanthobacteraceae bacterium]
MSDTALSAILLGTAMPTELTWHELVFRLLDTLIAGAAIGFNRGEHGKAAGLRTTMLVCMAASLAMLQMNYLLPLSGRTADSFVMNDLMRLPLGILTGVGFIGGGAILRRGRLVTGVTTAATLWYVTVIGLCFGGGQVLLGWMATGIGLLVLWGLRRLEDYMPVEQRARLAVTIEAGGPPEREIRRQLAAAAIAVRDVNLTTHGDARTYVFIVREVRRPSVNSLPQAIETLSREAGVSALDWRYFD